jgi:phosphoenolpyruvate-protein kinase (PTS system EI component)
MVETPAAALIADQFATEVNFFSLGTNDLTQYTLAADRGNPAVAALADPLHPAVLRLIRLVVEAARPRGLPVTICGEVAADLSAVPILLDLGVDALSVQPRAIPAVRAAMGG